MNRSLVLTALSISFVWSTFDNRIQEHIVNIIPIHLYAFCDEIIGKVQIFNIILFNFYIAHINRDSMSTIRIINYNNFFNSPIKW